MPEEFDHLKGIPNKGLKAIWANTTINLVCPPRSLPSAQGMRWICRGQTRQDGTISLALMFPWIIPNGEIRAAQAAGNISPSLPLDPLHILQKYSRNTPEILLDIPTLSGGSHLECLNLTPGASLLLKRHETTGSSGARRQNWLKTDPRAPSRVNKGDISAREETKLDYLKVPSGFKKNT